MEANYLQYKIQQYKITVEHIKAVLNVEVARLIIDRESKFLISKITYALVTSSYQINVLFMNSFLSKNKNDMWYRI